MSSPSLSAAQQNVSMLAGNMAPVNTYVQAVLQLPLGPQPLVLSGQQVGTFDPLAGSPGLSRALQNAQQNCWSFQDNFASELPAIPSILQACSGQIQGNFEQIQNVLSGLAGSCSPAATASAQSALQNLVEIFSPLSELLTLMASGATSFFYQLSGDDSALNEGAGAISSGITQIEQWVISAVDSYPLAGGIIEQIGSQMITDLQAISADIGSALAVAPVLPLALNGLENVFSVASDEYEDVSAQLASASNSGAVTILRELHVQNAESFWQDLITYIQTEMGSGSGI